MKVQIPQLGGAAQSIAGRDKGRFYLILGIEGDALLLADGKYRPTARPKRKNGKHVRLLPAFWPALASAALAGKDVNSEVRAQLLHLARERGQAAEQ